MRMNKLIGNSFEFLNKGRACHSISSRKRGQINWALHK